MTTTTGITMKTMNVDELTMLARQAGPCITLQVPAAKPGAGAGSRHSHLRQLTQEAAKRLGDLNRSTEATKVLESMEQLAATLDDTHGGPAFTLYAAPGFAGVYETPDVTAAKAFVGSRFHLLPALPDALAPHEFYILGLTRNKLRFAKYTNGRCEEAPLPAGVPASLAEAGAFDKPDHTLENFSSAGNTSGHQKGIRFSNSTDHDHLPEYLHNYYVTIDKALKEALAGVPLFLAGVKEEIAEYKKAAKYRAILENECYGNPEHAALDHMAAHAKAAARREYFAKGAQAAEVLNEVRNKIAGHPNEVFKAANEGRVRQIVCAEECPGDAFGDENLFMGENLANACCVEGLRTGADVFTVPGAEVCAGIPILAALRY